MGKPSKRSKEDAETKAERKFEKKLQFYSKIKETIASLNVEKSIKKKKRRSRLKAYDLSALADNLPDLKPPKEAKFKLNSKTRQSLVLREANQFNAVIIHPAFQSNPMEAIYRHLLSTQPQDEIKRKNSKSSSMET
ncbi:hypothetical protein LIER_19041 [Lithospermum erythrorhizon]|uniref:Ribosome biogenesis protein slx9-like n=1 Tax=Lithospermum erythrorhizon TaxID=34254 RepID=A0AAV3QG72_LITER